MDSGGALQTSTGHRETRPARLLLLLFESTSLSVSDFDDIRCWLYQTPATLAENLPQLNPKGHPRHSLMRATEGYCPPKSTSPP